MILDTFNFKDTSRHTDLITDSHNFSSPGLMAIIFIIPVLFSFGFSLQTWLNSNENWLAQHLSYEHTLMIFIFPVMNYFAIKTYLLPLILEYQSSKWLPATANIARINIIRITIPHKGYWEQVYLPAIHYKFSVNDRLYTGSRYSFEAHNAFHEMLGSSDGIDLQFEKYLDGKKVKVFYDPRDPNRSVIFNTLQPYSKVHYILMSLLVMSGIFSNIMCTLEWLHVI
jgi:hypothetical protein